MKGCNLWGLLYAACCTFTLLLALTSCSENPKNSASEDQRIEGPFEITQDWQVIYFEQPLAVSRTGYQLLHFVVDDALYIPNGDLDNDDVANHFNLRRSDGVLVKPEVILVAKGGTEIPVSAVSNTSFYVGGVSIGFGTYIDHYTAPPLYPAKIKAFHAAKVRSNEPFTAEYLRWWMDIRFPEGAPEPDDP